MKINWDMAPIALSRLGVSIVMFIALYATVPPGLEWAFWYGVAAALVMLVVIELAMWMLARLWQLWKRRKLQVS